MFIYVSKYRNHFSTYDWKTPDWFNFAAQSVINVFWNSWYPKLSRLSIIRIHKQDTWVMSHTLAPIILKMLKKLEKHGAPVVDDEDVPDELKSTNANGYADGYDDHVDELWFKRWDYVLESIIWSFEQLVDDTWEEQFHTGVIDWQSVPCEDRPGFVEMVDGPLHTHVWDKEGHLAYAARIEKGLKLFGKYYYGLSS